MNRLRLRLLSVAIGRHDDRADNGQDATVPKRQRIRRPLFAALSSIETPARRSRMNHPSPIAVPPWVASRKSNGPPKGEPEARGPSAAPDRVPPARS